MYIACKYISRNKLICCNSKTGGNKNSHDGKKWYIGFMTSNFPDNLKNN